MRKQPGSSSKRPGNDHGHDYSDDGDQNVCHLKTQNDKEAAKEKEASAAGKRGRIDHRKPPPNFALPQNEFVKINTKNEDGETVSYTIHKALICHHSPFFSAAFNSYLNEGETGVMKYTECTPQTFGLYQNWLYTRSLGTPTPLLSSLVDLYLLADKVISIELCNLILTHIYNTPTVWDDCTVDIFTKIYETPPYSKLRKLAVDRMYCKRELDALGDLGELPKNMLVEMLLRARHVLPEKAMLQHKSLYLDKEFILPSK